MGKGKVRHPSPSVTNSKSSAPIRPPTAEAPLPGARRILREYILSAQNRGADHRGLAALLDTMLANIERRVSGDITNDQLDQAEIPNIFRTPPPVSPPEWLDPDLTKRILDIVAAGGADHNQRAKELSDWIKKSYPAPAGAPWRPENYLLGLEAQKLYDSQKPKSWMKVARQICPQKGPGHRCSASCAGKLVQAAKQSKRFSF